MEVSFPRLGISLTLDRVAFSVFGVAIYWYALIIGVGYSLAVLYGFLCRRRFGVTKNDLLDLIIVGTVFGVIGARLYYVIFSGVRYNSLLDVINMRDGGVAIYGTVIGAGVSALIACRVKKVSFSALGDVMCVGFFIGQAIGRWGNFINQEAFGGATSLPWGMQSANTLAVVPDSPVHPCFLYESLWCAAGFVLLHVLSKKYYKFRGQLLISYALWYGLGRVWIEALRTDSLYLIPGVVKVSQLLALLSFALIPFLWRGLKGKSLININITVNEKRRLRIFVPNVPVTDIPDDEWTALDNVPEKPIKDDLADAWEKLSGWGKGVAKKASDVVSSLTKKNPGKYEKKPLENPEKKEQ